MLIVIVIVIVTNLFPCYQCAWPLLPPGRAGASKARPMNSGRLNTTTVRPTTANVLTRRRRILIWQILPDRAPPAATSRRRTACGARR
jgi:hypothetical protein